MDCSTPSAPVHHQLPELGQTHVHRVGDAASGKGLSPETVMFLLLFFADLRGWAFWKGCPAARSQHCGCWLCALWKRNPGGSVHGARSGPLHAGPSRYLVMKYEPLCFHSCPLPGIISWLFLILALGARESGLGDQQHHLKTLRCLFMGGYLRGSTWSNVSLRSCL